MSKDLRTYLKQLANTYPDHLKVVDTKVNPRFGITGHAAYFAERGEYPGLLFKNVEGSEFACLSNLLSSYERIALILDCDIQDIPRVFGERIKAKIAPKVIDKGQAPVKEFILRGEEADLSRLPIPVHNELDGGPYLSAGVLIIKDPDTGKLNAGIYRHQIYNKHELGVWFLGAHHGGLIFKKYQKLGKPAPIAIAIGHHPAFLMGAIARLQGIGGEYEAAGALMNGALNLVKAETSDLLVPADAEFIIEGEILPNLENGEGPFGEWPGHYLGGGSAPVIHVNTITHRRHAIFQDIVASGKEHLIVGSIPRSGSIYHAVKEVVPSLKTVNVPYYARMHCYLSLHKDREADVKKAAFTALNTEQENLRAIVVVDDDINVFNGEEVSWALGTRFDAERDLLTIPKWNGPGGLLPTNWEYHQDGSRTPRMSSALIADATKKAPPNGYPKRAVVPKKYREAVHAQEIRELNEEETKLWF